MIVRELIDMLKELPQDYEVCVDRGGAYGDAHSVECNSTLEIVFISDEPEAYLDEDDDGA